MSNACRTSQVDGSFGRVIPREGFGFANKNSAKLARVIVALLPFAVQLFWGSVEARAQTDRGTITGTVADPAGAVIPGAKIRAISVETGGVYDTLTTGTGNYTLPSLPAG